MAKNIYKRGDYAKLENHWRSTCKGIATRQALIAFGVSQGMTESAASASVTVLLSPRQASKRGDCRGNLSAQGHIYFAEPLAKVKGEDRKFRFRMRASALSKRTREDEKPAVVRAKTKKVKTAEPVAAPVAEPTVA